MMELLNAISKYQIDSQSVQQGLLRKTCRDLIKLMAPFAPHFCEEMWQMLGHDDSVFRTPWPKWDPEALVQDTVEIAVQVNGAIKYRLEVASNGEPDEIEAIVRADSRTEAALAGRSIVKVIVVKGRLVNLVVR